MTEPLLSARILIVDDEDIGRYTKSRLLRHAGFDVLEAAAGRPALDIVAREQPALVLLDVRLPDMSGIEVCKTIKAQFPGIMVLQTSATYVTPGDRTRGLDGGADSYLIQPIDPEELVAAIRALLRLHSAEESVRALNSSLEQRIHERTEALRNANAALIEQMAQRERAEAALVQSQKLEAVGQLTGVMAHDFNNVLAATKGYLHLITKRAQEPQIIEMAEKALGVVLRGSKLTSRLLAFARTSPLLNETVDVGALLLGMEDWLNHSTGKAIELRVTVGPAVTVAVTDPHQLELAVLNLTINSRDAMPQGGHIDIRVDNRSLDLDAPDLRAGEYIAVSVIDDGPGMPPEVAARAFEPFFTTKPAGRGTGLGMAQVQQLVRQSNGAVRLDTGPGRGTRIELWLPAGQTDDLPSMSGALQGVPPLEASSVLVVDDDADIRHTVASAFEARGYHVLRASGGREALECIQAERPRAVVLDVSMPGMSGIQVALAAREFDPGIGIVFMSGNADSTSIEQAFAGVRLMRKPFDPAHLIAMLEDVVRKGRRAGG